MLTRRTWWWPVALFFFGAAMARAHDALQSSTDIWLRPDQMEIELIMARVPARALVDDAPPVPVTDDDFESTYHALFQKSAPGLVEITLDGKKIEPGSITVELYQETDLRFDYLFPRPPNGRLGFTASFIKRMDDGYINTLGVNEGSNVLGSANQDINHPTWEISLSLDEGAPASPPANLAATPPAINPGPAKIGVAGSGTETAANKNFFFSAGLFWIIVFLIAIGAFFQLRKKRRTPPRS